MITTLYYYDHYKPYLLGNSENDSKDGISTNTVSKAKPKIQTQTANKDRSIYLNKSLSRNVVSYVNDFSTMVNKMKDSSRHILKDMDEVKSGSLNNKEFAETKEWLEQDIESFVSSYNDIQNFDKGRESSKIFNEFSNKLSTSVAGNVEKLESLGVSLSISGELEFDKESFNSLNKNTLKKSISSAENTVFDVNQSTTQIMKEPLSKHLNFKELGYYYNYGIGSGTDPHELIGTGFIIDRFL